MFRITSTFLTPILTLWLTAAASAQTSRPTAQLQSPRTNSPAVGQFEILGLSEGTHFGSLGAGSARGEDGRLQDRYDVTLHPGSWARFWVHSDAFDTVLEVRGPDDFSVTNDDFVPGLLHSVVEFRPPAPGTYTLTVRAFWPGAEGAYELGMTRVDPSRESQVLSVSSVDGELVPSGLGSAAPVWGSYWTRVSAGERLRFRITSPSFDTVGLLVGPDGQLWSNDDANDTGPDGTESLLDSTVTAIAPSEGWYHLIVLPYGGSGSGAFRVAVSSRSAHVLEPDRTPSRGYAGTQSEGRILALFAGISHYPGEDADLYGCADDATLLARAFRERGLQEEADQLILTNSQATTEAFLSGIRALAGRATEDDVVLIFYSGHGDTTAEGPVAELDGTDERLVLYDGELLDNDIVAELNNVRADTLILALDACNSGGFEDDFVTQPGRIGIFSSNSDVRSDTAEAVGAGGYLSYYLRQAVLGHADSRPRDGALTAGELTDYLYVGFLMSHETMNPGDSNAPYQILQSNRGSVAHNALLWLYPRESNGQLSEMPELLPLLSEPPDESNRSAGGANR